MESRAGDSGNLFITHRNFTRLFSAALKQNGPFLIEAVV
jgi:hypothetical protein